MGKNMNSIRYLIANNNDRYHSFDNNQHSLFNRDLGHSNTGLLF